MQRSLSYSTHGVRVLPLLADPRRAFPSSLGCMRLSNLDALCFALNGEFERHEGTGLVTVFPRLLPLPFFQEMPPARSQWLANVMAALHQDQLRRRDEDPNRFLGLAPYDARHEPALCLLALTDGIEEPVRRRGMRHVLPWRLSPGVLQAAAAIGQTNELPATSARCRPTFIDPCDPQDVMHEVVEALVERVTCDGTIPATVEFEPGGPWRLKVRVASTDQAFTLHWNVKRLGYRRFEKLSRLLLERCRLKQSDSLAQLPLLPAGPHNATSVAISTNAGGAKHA
jgi:hypothetical protein